MITDSCVAIGLGWKVSEYALDTQRLNSSMLPRIQASTQIYLANDQ
jgi:hypothetical protein